MGSDNLKQQDFVWLFARGEKGQPEKEKQSLRDTMTETKSETDREQKFNCVLLTLPACVCWLCVDSSLVDYCPAGLI